MKIISDNPELLDEIHKKLKIARIKVKKESKTVDGAMADEVTIALEIFHQVKEHYDDVLMYIYGVKELAKYLKSNIKVQKVNGKAISFEEFEELTLEEKQEIYRA